MRFTFAPTAIEAYRRYAARENLHDMSGRIGQPCVTKLINDNIIKAISPREGDTIVDIGCGDGSLLAAIKETLNNVCLYGVLPTDEEVLRVQTERNNRIKFSRGIATDTPLPSAIADKIVCNGVLIYVPRRKYRVALSEFHRIVKPGGLVFIGELLETNERHTNSLFARLKIFVKYIRSRISWCARNEFIKIAKESGLELVEDFQHRHFTPDGAPYDLETRRDYVFRAV